MDFDEISEDLKKKLIKDFTKIYKEQNVLKALMKIRSELVIKLHMLQDNPDERYPKSFIDGMTCAFFEAISICDINTKEFFDKD